MSGRDAVLGRLRTGYWIGLRSLWRWRRAWLILRVKATAAIRYAHVELDIADHVMLSKNVRVEIEPGTSNRLTIGPHTRLKPGVDLWLRGGTIQIGARCAVRSDVRVISSGMLVVGDDVLLSFGLVVHCTDSVTIGEDTIIGEYSTITDSVHRRTGDSPVWHHVSAAPTTIGANVWIAASVVVTHGVTIGDRAFVAAKAVVTKDVPTQWLAAGAPAVLVRELAIDEDGPT